jgi:hypothetical protein
MSSLGVPAPEHASRTSFSANHGQDVTVVLNQKAVSFPAVTPRAKGPHPFLVSIVLDRPFALSAPQNLLVELDFTPTDQKDPNPWFLDAERYDSTMWGIRATPFGKGCPSTGEFRVFHFTTGSQESLTLNWASDASPKLSGVIALGLSNKRVGPFPLPLDLTLIGAPGCLLYHDLWAYLNSRLLVYQNGSQLVASLPVPRDFRLTGLELFVQGFIADPKVNRLGLRVSGGVRLDFDTPPSPFLGLVTVGIPASDRVASRLENLVFVLGLN